MIIVPFLINTAGWMLTESGRQPWIVQGLMKTANGVSPSVSATDIWISLIVFYLIFIAFGIADTWLMIRYGRKPLDHDPIAKLTDGDPPADADTSDDGRAGARLLGGPDDTRRPLVHHRCHLLGRLLHVWRGSTSASACCTRSSAAPTLERRVLVNTIGPTWDGNEVWLIVAGAVIFAAFPAWYATMFSSLYLAMVLLLVALIVRGLSFEYQRKFDDPRWRSFWRWGLTIGSALIPFLVGVALGDLLHGLPINSHQQFTGNFFGLLTPFGLWTGLTLVVLSLLVGVHVPDC